MAVRKVEAEDIEREGADAILGGVDGILVPGGFGYRGVPGKVEAIRFAREKGVPFFGICLGLQCAAIEFARNVIGLEDANTTEIDHNCTTPSSACSMSSIPLRTWAVRCVWDRTRASWRRGAGRWRPTASRRSRSGTGTVTSSTTSIGNNSRRMGWHSRA